MELVGIEELKSNIALCLRQQGHNSDDADIIRNVLLFAELRGNNQGIVKLVSGALAPKSTAPINIVHQSQISARVDGGQRAGMVVVNHCVNIACEKAGAHGMAIVGCSNYSSATGALGYWARNIANCNLIGIVLSQCPEMVAPHGSYEPIFGTNPLAIGIPTAERPQILDMATSASAWYGLVSARDSGKSIPDDVAYDCHGKSTTDPAAALAGAIRVFDRSHKGSHLALMVELLAGALTGAAMSDKSNAKNWGSLIIAIDPNVISPLEEFQASAAVMCERVKNAKRLPAAGSDSDSAGAGQEEEKVWLPGERGDQLEADNLSKGTIPMLKATYDALCLMVSTAPVIESTI